MRPLEIIKTSDDSSSIYVPEIDETYHSVNGAVQESLHIFINLGLNNYIDKNCELSTVNIFEMGFGTGLNALLSVIEAEKQNVCINYVTCEKYVLTKDYYSQLNYPKILNVDDDIFMLLHECAWNQKVNLTDNFTITKMQEDINNLDFSMFPQFNVIYYDAFSPSKQPELWNENILSKMYNILINSGLLATYCAKNAFKKTLRNIGFEVNNYPGPPGKREVTVAVKP
ncbi:MAG: tRNA (5-methylaminomethyl-2-thiouridine)(34)-methyltransferase MnmD [Bacteroidales bacterium]|jgi:tRNA U34 5-methylaminomethyl-2-thiouridine-forming methyltransferase MnmC|nr:tRNA (5-methylaminomethyl-2-thiouridine)(34)-methyltransferase MnmD [Bacteroidales bacterium]MDD2204283.1 tRNA (5-methylaminomethyl-2-thiouridine)(34)-methyltransferase MnmD [Bacteroidales bacterium]MDD3151336.1 tRNA (5-methylaminomethyl-2-thiouridine)(34)-methyltransferase MnmD [Bacteroidales bacterium]MDD3913164.1 tRNA (5-methylaminomethyl-2-thiouridine)(34)-methyltransferase MnmD [Bacteroidales bacterium]MDD4633079.1 tRNA (5-methylaminomethyl-2-thiouridine)(34)-methyltransferase MnmD [Bac